MTVSIVRASLEGKERFQISYWDAAIIEAARALGCRTVLSEDLSSERGYDGVKVEDPFEIL
jgi:predicted nucleic acid-binding protein